MKKEMLFSLACICFCSAIQATTETPAGNGKDPMIKREPLNARLSLSDDNIERIIANDPRPLHLTMAPPRVVNTFWPNFGKSKTVTKSNIGKNENKTEAVNNMAIQEFWTEVDQQELKGLSIQVQCYTPPLMVEGINGPGPAKVKSEWGYREWMLRRIDELEKKNSRTGGNIIGDTSLLKWGASPTPRASGARLTPTPRAEPTPRAIMRPWRLRH